MKAYCRSRLSLMMFCQYFAAGVWLVPLGTYMSKVLHYDSIIGATYGMIGIGTIVSTLSVGALADRLVAAEKMLAFLAFGAASTLFFLAVNVHSPSMFLLGMLLHCLFYTASIPMGVSIAFHGLSDPGQDYPGVRVFGSIGWVAAGLIVGLMHGAAQTRLPLLMGAASYLMLAAYAVTLPHAPPLAKGQQGGLRGLFGLDIITSKCDRTFWVLMACILLVTIPKRFYDSYLNNYLVEAGVSLKILGLTLEPTAVQSFGQIAEILTILVIPFLLLRIGIKMVMLVGMLSWIVRLVLFAFGFHDGTTLVSLIVIGVLLQGISYDFFFVSGQIWLDRRFPQSQRSRAQSFYWFLHSGVGVVVGANVAGVVYNAYTVSPVEHRWPAIWLVPAAITIVVMLVFMFMFRESDGRVKAIRPQAAGQRD